MDSLSVVSEGGDVIENTSNIADCLATARLRQLTKWAVKVGIGRAAKLRQPTQEVVKVFSEGA